MKRISFSAPEVAASATGAKAGVGVGEGSADAGVPTAAPWTGGTPDGETIPLVDAVIDSSRFQDDGSGSAASLALAVLEREAFAEFDAEPNLEIVADSLAKADPEG
jgi:hypothetical protein